MDCGAPQLYGPPDVVDNADVDRRDNNTDKRSGQFWAAYGDFLMDIRFYEPGKRCCCGPYKS